MLKSITKSNIEKYIDRTVYFIIILVICIGLSIVLYNIYKLYKYQQFNEPLVKVFTALAVVSTLLLGIYQAKKNVWLKRRETTMSDLPKLIKEIQSYRKEIRDIQKEYYKKKIITLDELIEERKPLTEEILHSWICNVNEKNEYITEKDKNFYQMTEDGKKTREAILHIINVYELISRGVYSHVYDENLVIDLMGSLVTKNWKIYETYINHRRTRHKSKHFGDWFQALARRFEEKTEFKPKMGT